MTENNKEKTGKKTNKFEIKIKICEIKTKQNEKLQ